MVFICLEPWIRSVTWSIHILDATRNNVVNRHDLSAGVFRVVWVVEAHDGSAIRALDMTVHIWDEQTPADVVYEPPLPRSSGADLPRHSSTRSCLQHLIVQHNKVDKGIFYSANIMCESGCVLATLSVYGMGSRRTDFQSLMPFQEEYPACLVSNALGTSKRMGYHKVQSHFQVLAHRMPALGERLKRVSEFKRKNGPMDKEGTKLLSAWGMGDVHENVERVMIPALAHIVVDYLNGFEPFSLIPPLLGDMFMVLL